MMRRQWDGGSPSRSLLAASVLLAAAGVAACDPSGGDDRRATTEGETLAVTGSCPVGPPESPSFLSAPTVGTREPGEFYPVQFNWSVPFATFLNRPCNPILEYAAWEREDYFGEGLWFQAFNGPNHDQPTMPGIIQAFGGATYNFAVRARNMYGWGTFAYLMNVRVHPP
jgi:hypothetical protein